VKIDKDIFVLGDRVLIEPDTEKNQTDSGLYLPQGLAAKERIQSGFIIKVGPGYILPPADSSEPWLDRKSEQQFIPLQVEAGDYAIFLRKEAVEIEYNEIKYLIVSQPAILAVVRDKLQTGIEGIKEE